MSISQPAPEWSREAASTDPRPETAAMTFDEATLLARAEGNPIRRLAEYQAEGRRFPRGAGQITFWTAGTFAVFVAYTAFIVYTLVSTQVSFGTLILAHPAFLFALIVMAALAHRLRPKALRLTGAIFFFTKRPEIIRDILMTAPTARDIREGHIAGKVAVDRMRFTRNFTLAFAVIFGLQLAWVKIFDAPIYWSEAGPAALAQGGLFWLIARLYRANRVARMRGVLTDICAIAHRDLNRRHASMDSNLLPIATYGVYFAWLLTLGYATVSVDCNIVATTYHLITIGALALYLALARLAIQRLVARTPEALPKIDATLDQTLAALKNDLQRY